MKLYGNRKRAEHTHVRPKKKKRRLRKGFAVFLLIFLTVVLTACAMAFQWIRPPELSSETKRENDVAALDEIAAPENPRKEDFVTILLIGRDKVGLNTDVIMLMAYDIKNNKISMMSIPRDTMVNVERKNKKINSAYSQGGKANLEELMLEVESIVGFRPDRYLLVTVDAFCELIDEIGGVTVDVPMDMYYSDPEQDLTIDIKKGLQTLNGYDSMGFMRFRATYARGDLERIEMQHRFIDAFMAKLVSPKTITKIPSLAEILIKNVKTDLSTGNLVWMAKEAVNMDLTEDFKMFTLPGEAQYYKHLSYFMAYESKTLELINAHFNPYVDPITNVDLPHVKLANNKYSDELDKEEMTQ
ncbi:MAG: LytR family transcriptional regulator [Ruminococcaceae bacterium]|nr:LytR family transcriptional regulator [Oscillospiraceae bacterium]